MPQPQRALFKIVLPGDLRKVDASSNDSPTGGGARDIRLPHRTFERIIEKMFPTVTLEPRKRNGARVMLGARNAQLEYFANGQDGRIKITYEPPTDARGTEGRITKVHQMPPFASANFPHGEGDVFYLLIQGDTGTLTAHYASEKSLRATGVWNPWVAEAILKALSETPPNRSALGWLDFTTGQSYTSGKAKKK